jgi:hypothetical protein
VYPEPVIKFIVRYGRRWVAEQRERHRRAATGLASDEIAALTGFYPGGVLSGVKIAFVPQIENPGLYTFLAQRGVKFPFDFRFMNGITFVDTIAIADSRGRGTPEILPLLFHELVHVVQYRTLGVHRFIDRYVRGWMENGSVYLRIPLEAHAYDLQSRYVGDPASRFSVDAAVLAMNAAY